MITEEKPSIICLVETHLDKCDTVEIQGSHFEKTKAVIAGGGGGGGLTACEDRIKNITIQVHESNEVKQILFVKIDNDKTKLRVEVIYAPQEIRTLDKKTAQSHLEDQVKEVEKKSEKLILVSDFNCKIAVTLKGTQQQ